MTDAQLGHMAAVRARENLMTAAIAEAVAIRPIISRYDAILQTKSAEVRQEDVPGTSFAHLRWMLSVIDRPHAKSGAMMTPLKMRTWLGFVQGIMIERGILTVPQERAATRAYLAGR